MSDTRRAGGRPLALLLGYPVLALAGAFSHRQGLSLAALALLGSLLLWPGLRERRARPWLCWLALMAGLVGVTACGLAALLLDTVPVLVNLLLAWLFGQTLCAGRQPLVARFIEAIEGPSRLAAPGIARYARQLTLFWTLLLGGQAVLLGILLLFQAPGGVLLRLGLAPPWTLPRAWVEGYVHVGAYLLLAAAFALEYLFRRWHLRHLPHLRLHDFLRRLALRWPQLIRGRNRSP